MNFNNFRFDNASKTTDQPHTQFIRLCSPVWCSCSTFINLTYCPHILAINKINLAFMVLDPTHKEKTET